MAWPTFCYHRQSFFAAFTFMSILAYGLNYRTASLDLRERIAFPEEKLAQALKSVTNDISGVSEVAIISTCNRTEFYCAADPSSGEDISHWLADTRLIALNELENASYQYWDHDAAQHIIRVASGLDSQMLGEPQIMGQIKSAYDIARTCGTIGPELNLLSRITLQTAKQIRSETGIGKNPISIAYAAVSMAGKIFENLSTKKALLLGAGETIGLVSDHLAAKNIGSMTIANRTLANAQLLARKYNAVSELGEVLDPIADKILIVFVLFGLAVNLSSYLIAFIGALIITREIWVGALRDLNARNNRGDATKVTFLAKIKTTIQLFTLSIYLLALTLNNMLLIIFADIFLFISLFITLYTGLIYTLNSFASDDSK